MHRAWANVRERGHWQLKQEKAISKPDDAISISIDGTFRLVLVITCLCYVFFYFFFVSLVSS
jgi:hypothetical protein